MMKHYQETNHRSVVVFSGVPVACSFLHGAFIRPLAPLTLQNKKRPLSCFLSWLFSSNLTFYSGYSDTVSRGCYPVIRTAPPNIV